MDPVTPARTSSPATRTTHADVSDPASNLLEGPVRLLDLDYAPEVPDNLLARMERIGRDAGMPLAQLELLGQDATACWEFNHLSETVSVEGAILSMDWIKLDAILQSRRAVSH